MIRYREHKDMKVSFRLQNLTAAFLPGSLTKSAPSPPQSLVLVRIFSGASLHVLHGRRLRMGRGAAPALCHLFEGMRETRLTTQAAPIHSREFQNKIDKIVLNSIRSNGTKTVPNIGGGE